jgi:ribonuclease Z
MADDLTLTFLGTSAAVPTAQRGLSSTLVSQRGSRLLIDCGEGTQRQLARYAGLIEVDAVLLTHWHADHCLGLLGLLKTYALTGRLRPIDLVAADIDAHWPVLAPLLGDLPFEVRHITAVAGETVWKTKDLSVSAFPTEHTAASVGYLLSEPDRPGRVDLAAADQLGVTAGPLLGALQRGEVVDVAGRTVTPSQVVGPARRGRRVVLTGDTAPTPATASAAAGADVLVHEATFTDDLRERAAALGHSTARQAARVAAEAGVTMLVLTHLSQQVHPANSAAQASRVLIPDDGDVLTVPLPERGPPTLGGSVAV